MKWFMFCCSRVRSHYQGKVPGNWGVPGYIFGSVYDLIDIAFVMIPPNSAQFYVVRSVGGLRERSERMTTVRACNASLLLFDKMRSEATNGGERTR